jgi:hypothetical protein
VPITNLWAEGAAFPARHSPLSCTISQPFLCLLSSLTQTWPADNRLGSSQKSGEGYPFSILSSVHLPNFSCLSALLNDWVGANFRTTRSDPLRPIFYNRTTDFLQKTKKWTRQASEGIVVNQGCPLCHSAAQVCIFTNINAFIPTYVRGWKKSFHSIKNHSIKYIFRNRIDKFI